MNDDYHILVVDDHPDNRLLLQASLEPCGYRVTALADGEASLAAVAERPEEFDLILLDMKMPGLTGLDVLNGLRQHHSRFDLPVIMVTALGHDDHMVSALQAGANDYVTKPVHFEPLAERIKTQLDLVASRRALAAEVKERRRAQARYEEMAESLCVATRSAGIGLWEWSPNDGQFTWDASLCALYGIDPIKHKAGRHTWQRLVHPDDLERFERKLDDALAGRGSFNTTFRIVRPDGEIRHFEGHASVHRSPKGRVTKATGANWDITERRQAREATLEAAERERERIGRDLHDSLCQELGGIGLLSAAMEERMRQAGHDEREFAAAISERLVLATEQARALAHGLSPLASERHSLSEALEVLLDRQREANPLLQTILEIEFDTERLPPAHASELYLIASEAVSNALRHGHPGRIRLDLREEGDDLVLTIDDDGSGCADALKDTGGIGLGSMKHRAWTLGGVINLSDGSTGTGVNVECRLPKT